MNQVNYVFDDETTTSTIATVMQIRDLLRHVKQWRRLALVSFGLFMASVIVNLIQFLGR